MFSSDVIIPIPTFTEEPFANGGVYHRLEPTPPLLAIFTIAKTSTAMVCRENDVFVVIP
jgi:hypothetical protein